MSMYFDRIEFQALHTALEARLRENESYVVSTNNETVNFFYSVSIVYMVIVGSVSLSFLMGMLLYV